MPLAEDDDRRVLLKLSSGDFFVDHSDPTMLTIASKFLRHEKNDPAIDGTTTIKTAPEDEVAAYSEFYIDKDGREDDEILLKTITVKIKARNPVTEKEFDVDPFVYGVSDQNMNFTLERIFHIPTDEVRKTIKIQRRTDLDVLEKEYYSVQFPFKIRWEYWIKCLTANSAFFDALEPQNGLNQEWYRYASLLADWDLYYEIIIDLTKNGHDLQYTDENIIASYDYDSNAFWSPTSIKSYDGATELITAGTQYIMGYKDTKIVAKFANATTGGLDLNDYVVNILIEIFEQGGVEGQRRMSSLWASSSDTWFKSIDDTDKTVLSLATTSIADDTILATVNIDYLLLQKASKYKITARLYDLNGDTDVDGYCLTQEFSLVAEDPDPTGTTLPVASSLLKDCCGANSLKVFADAANDDEFKTDTSSVMWWFSPFVDDATMELMKWNGTDWEVATALNNDDYGTLTAYGDFVNNTGEKFVGYEINWALVMNAFDPGSYKVRLTISSPFGSSTMDSAEYCLSAFSDVRANGTIRIEYYLNGIMGDNSNDLKTRDFGDLNLYNSLRLPGYFGFPNSKYEKNYTIYDNGSRQWTKDEQEPEYIMQIKRVPAAIHNLMRTDVAQADVILVTDYNRNNAEQWIQKSVQLTSGYPPDWKILRSKLAPVKLTFRAGINNLKKYRD